MEIVIILIILTIDIFDSPAVMAPDFMARDIGFENTAGPEGHQAVAFRCQGDQAILFNCHFDGYQDTLYASSKRQFYRDCTITGTVDFIFGNAFALFQNCNIIARKPLPNQQNILTAHGSKWENESTVYVIHNCSIFAEPALVPFIAQNPSFLGRPWKERARTIYMQSYIGNLIHSDGWMPWENEPNSINTCLYSEIDNYGPGAKKDGRVKWPGIKDINIKHADMYTLDALYQGAEWVKKSGAAFSPGMLPPSSRNQPAPPAPTVTQMQVDPIITGPIPPKRKK